MTSEIRKYAALVRAKQILQHALKRTTADMTATQEIVLEQFSESGTRSATVDNLNVHIKAAYYAGACKNIGEDDTKADERLCDALRLTGDVEIIRTRPHPSTLAALAREYIESDGHVPKEWYGAIKVSEVFKLGATRV